MKIKPVFDKIIKSNKIVLFYIICNFLNAILLRLFTTGRFQLRSIFFDIAFVLLLSSLSCLVKNKNRYYIITTFIMSVICVVNSLYFNYYSSFISVSLLATSVFVKDVGDAVVEMVVRWCDLSYLIMVIGIIILAKKDKTEIKITKKDFKSIFLIAFISLAIGCSLPPYNAYSRFYKLWNRVAVVNSWGPYVYQIDDIIQSLKPTFNNMFGYDKALKETNDYYSMQNNKVKKNKYTGIFEGKNVIAIHAESLQSFVIDYKINDEEVTPTINKLASEGIYFSNFYSQVGVGTSSDTEFTYATSLLPANNGTVFVNYFNNKFITIQNLLKNKGYYVFSMHGNVGDFWNRETMHSNMGYDKFYSKSSFVIDEEYGLGLSDGSFFRQVVPMIKEINDEVNMPYYGTLITLTNHTPWKDTELYSDFDVGMTVNVDGEIIRGKYLEDTAMGKYIKAVNYMDKSIGEFIDNMDKEGLLDNTVIVIYGDHDARIPKDQFEYMYNYDYMIDGKRAIDDPEYLEFNNYDYELSKKVPFIIWTKDMTNGVNIDIPMGMIDVLPTLGNMLNIYNKYSLGHDVMSVKREDAIVVFKDSSYITDKIYYSARNNDVYPISSYILKQQNKTYTISDGVISDDYINSRSEYADEIIKISDNIITYDLINKLN